MLLLSAAARGQAPQPQQRDMAKEQKIWQQLQAVAPQSLGAFKRATEALDSGDYEEAARLYGEVRKSAPEFTPALRREGLALAESGKREEGLPLLEQAATLERTPENFISLAQVLALPVTGEKESRAADVERALTLAVEADRMSSSADSSYPALVAQLSLELQREAPFRKAAETLRRKFPDELATHYFSGVEAMMDEHWLKAESEIEKAEAKGLPHELAEQLLNSGVRTHARVWRAIYWVLYAAAAWAAGLLLLFVLGKVFSNLTLRTVESAD
ncbi:MAG TPA: hypothetical protein VF521_10315, partial [Pyrinomonadaceae bacterium]